MHLFAEIFPIEQPPALTAYHLRLYELPEDYPPVDVPRLGRRLLSRLRKILPGGWIWNGECLITDTEAMIFEITEALEVLKADDPDNIGFIEALEPDFMWTPTPHTLADFVIRTRLNTLDDALNAALAKFNRELYETIRVEREYKATAWEASGQPAVALSTAARLICKDDAQTFATLKRDPQVLIGLRVSDKTSPFSGEITKITGTVEERREKMLNAADKSTLRKLIQNAPGDDLAVRVVSGDEKVEYPASALELLVRPSDFALFKIDERSVDPILRPDPPTRSMMIKALADIAKEAGILGKAFNAREQAALFAMPDFHPYLRYAKNRSRPYKPSSLSLDFIQCGAYHLRDAFKTEPIRACVVNALPNKIEDFVEALQRQLTRSFDFKIDVIRERKVRVVSLENLESAVRVVEKEQPDMILAFIPDANKTQEGEDLPAFVKSLTLGRGIPSHVIFQKTLDDPEAMPEIIMAMLAKTGNTPFALADPLDFADYVVGLDFVRDTAKDSDVTTVTAIARIYRSSGEFVRYAVRRVELSGNALPYVLMRDLFPQRDFAGKRIVIHHEGRLTDDAKQALFVWGQAIKAGFYPVEIIRRGAPRLYCFSENRVQSPPWGSYFRLNDHEGFVVLSLEEEKTPQNETPKFTPKRGEIRPHVPTPQPLHIIATTITIEQAVRSLQLWTLLYYGVSDVRIPVTIYGAGELGYWMRKGGTIQAPEGEVPFWL
jgi:hypothetical protein